MRFPRNLPIQRKVTLVVLVTATACLIVACLALFAFQLLSFRRNFISDLSALSDVVANSSIASVAFNDKDAAVVILGGLKAKAHVRSASILKEGEILAQFGEADNLTALARHPKETGYVFDGNSLLHSQPILFDEEPIGMLYVRSDYRQCLPVAAEAVCRDSCRRARRVSRAGVGDFDAAPAIRFRADPEAR
jgi:hypothetical protein